MEESEPTMLYENDTKDILRTQRFGRSYSAISKDDIELKLYKRRWLILAMFVLYSFCSSVQWFQYSIISNLISKYYGVSSWEVDLTSIVYMITYVSLSIPVSYLMDRLNLKTSAIIAVSSAMMGSWMKVLSCSPERFYVSLTGQSLVALSQIFILCVPPKLASVWFGHKEVSSACSIGTFGTQLGMAASFFISPLLVKDHEDKTLIGKDLRLMFILIASFSTAISVLVIMFFQSHPMKPPSYSEACKVTAASEKSVDYFGTLKRIFTHRGFTIMFITAGVNNGCFNSLSTLFNQIFISYFPENNTSAGMIGTSMVFSGMISSIIFGFVMDKTKKFREIILTVYFLSAASVFILMQALEWSNLIAVYIGAVIVGTFLSGFTATSVAYTAEVTYPESEVITATIIYLGACLFGVILTIIIRSVNETYGVYYGLLSFSGTLMVGAITMSLIKLEYKRQNAHKEITSINNRCSTLEHQNCEDDV